MTTLAYILFLRKRIFMKIQYLGKSAATPPQTRGPRHRGMPAASEVGGICLCIYERV